VKESVGRVYGKLLGPLMPISTAVDPALHERLIASGLFAELDALRWGGHPYLPKVEFYPGGRALGERFLRTSAVERHRPALERRARAAGLDYESLLEAHIREVEEDTPGRLELDVEAGKDRVPGAARFRELLGHLVRIAQINAEANQLGESTIAP